MNQITVVNSYKSEHCKWGSHCLVKMRCDKAHYASEMRRDPTKNVAKGNLYSYMPGDPGVSAIERDYHPLNYKRIRCSNFEKSGTCPKEEYCSKR
jgi:hypothetical protein